MRPRATCRVNRSSTTSVTPSMEQATVDLARRAGSQFRIPPMYGSLERLAPNPERHALGWTAKRPAGTIAIGSRHRGHELVGCVEIPRVTFIVSRWRRELFDDRLAGTNDRFGPTKDAAVMADEVGNCPSRAMRNGGRRRRAEDGRRHRSVGEHGLEQLCVIHSPSVARGQGSGGSREVIDEATRQRPLRIAVASQQLAPQSGGAPHLPVWSPHDAPQRQCSVCEPR